MTFQVRRPGSTDFWINDLSQEIVAGETIDLLYLHSSLDLSSSFDLVTAIQIGNLIRVKSSSDVPIAQAFQDLFLPKAIPDISASAAESEAEWNKSNAIHTDSVAERAQSLGRIKYSYAHSEADWGTSIARRANSLADYQANIFNNEELPPSIGGGIWFNDGIFPYIHNPFFDKWLSVTHYTFLYNYNGPCDNVYLGIGTSHQADVGYYMRNAGIILGVWTRILPGSVNLTKTFELHDDVGTVLYSWSMPNDYIVSVFPIAIEIPAGTILRIFCTSEGGKVTDPLVSLEIAWEYLGPLG